MNSMLVTFGDSSIIYPALRNTVAYWWQERFTVGKQFVLSLVLLILTGCGGIAGAPVTSQPHAEVLTTTRDLDSMAELENTANGIAIGYPEGWNVSEEDDDDFVILVPDESKWDSLCLDQPCYDIFTSGPYVGRFSRRYRIPRTALTMMKDTRTIYDDRTDVEIIEAPTSLDIGGHDGASLLVVRHDPVFGPTYKYYITLRLTEEKVVNFIASSSEDEHEEMIDTLNAIALSIRPLE